MHGDNSCHIKANIPYGFELVAPVCFITYLISSPEIYQFCLHFPDLLLLVSDVGIFSLQVTKNGPHLLLGFVVETRLIISDLGLKTTTATTSPFTKID